VGAGDTSISATAAAMAAGATPLESATLANFASVVTVQKIRTTGTATPQEIREVGADPDYVFRPELASDPRSARYFEDSEIECITGSVPSRGIKHALFDHDGTISTLRQGWEPIMEDMFIRTILGPAYATADETLYRRVADRVREYIIRSTGIQTLKQMLALGDMVRELGYVPASQVLDPHGYKRIYLEALMKTVSARVKKFSRKELNVEDFTIKGSVDFLKALRIRGVRLYLASGTDDADVKAEAHALGYAELFDGGIHGATDDVQHDAKRVVIDRILTTNQLNGSELVCFGDGPVELREGRKRGGMAVGIASDEVRRYGMSPEKRSRLICAGADVIIADFSQPEALLKRLFG
jgi:phosphoglycolate phosphatase-like HAD superfamily hydrolase